MNAHTFTHTFTHTHTHTRTLAHARAHARFFTHAVARKHARAQRLNSISLKQFFPTALAHIRNQGDTDSAWCPPWTAPTLSVISKPSRGGSDISGLSGPPTDCRAEQAGVHGRVSTATDGYRTDTSGVSCPTGDCLLGTDSQGRTAHIVKFI